MRKAFELQTHLAASIGALLAEMPSDEATDSWAEVVEEEVHEAIYGHSKAYTQLSRVYIP